MAASPTATELLKRVCIGDSEAFDQLYGVVYGDLRKIARRQLNAEVRSSDLSSGDLVHEAYVKLIDAKTRNWQSRTHFFALGAKVMRQILVDRARQNTAIKRGGSLRRIFLDDSLLTRNDDEHVLLVEEALEKIV